MEEKPTSSEKTSETSEPDLPKLLKQLKNLIIAQNVTEIKASLDSYPMETRRSMIHNQELGQSLFFQACIVKAMDIIEYFITDCMADVNEVGHVSSLGKDKLTPLFIAIRWCNIPLIDLLVEHGANLHWSDHADRNAIVYACFLHRMEAAHTLKKHGANINSCKNQDLCVQDVCYLSRALKLDLDMDYLNTQGMSFLMKAAIKGDLGVIKVLFKTQVNVYIRSTTCGSNALDLALRLHQKDVVNYFINNSVYTLADQVLSYEYCGAIEVLLGKNMDNAAKFWDLARDTRTENLNTIEAAMKENPILDNSSDIGSAKFYNDTVCLGQWTIYALRIVLRILGENHVFLQRAFNFAAYCPDFQSDGYLTADRIREFCELNSTSTILQINGAYLAMTGVSYMCENQFAKCKLFPETIIPFLETIVELLADVVFPSIQRANPSVYLYHVYKHMLLVMLHLIEYALETECPGKGTLSKVISKAAKTYLRNCPTTLLLVAVERGFAFKTIVCLIAAGSDVNACDFNQNTPLHFLAEQPIHLPNRIKIHRFLVMNGSDLYARNDYGMRPRISLTAT